MRKAADYIYWLRDMAERETMNVRPCSKALRRAADCFEELEAQLAEMKPYIQHKYGCISRTPMYDETEDDLIIPPCDCGLDEIIHKEKGDEG